MSWAPLKNKGGTANEGEKALVVVAFVHLVELQDSAEHLRVIVLKIFRHLLEPGILFSKKDASCHGI